LSYDYFMTSLLDDAKRMLKLGYGDIPRLKLIKKTLEKNKMLYISDRQYLSKLTQDHPENSQVKTSQYNSRKTTSYLPDDDLKLDELEELEEKIRVDSEPSWFSTTLCTKAVAFIDNIATFSTIDARALSWFIVYPNSFIPIFWLIETILFFDGFFFLILFCFIVAQ